MYCVNCGSPLAPGAVSCPRCAQRVQQFAPAAAVPNYLVGAILTTLCCCMPLGIVAVVYAAQVNTKLAQGDVAGAQMSSQNARTWIIIALIAGIVSFGGFALLPLIL